MKPEKIAYLKGYRMDREGNFINPKNEIVRGQEDKNGYLRTGIRYNGKRYWVCFHRMQAYLKYGEDMYKPGIVVRHLKGDNKNNSYANIGIGTHSDNMNDIPKAIRIEKALNATSYIRKYDKKEVSKYYNTCKSYKKTMDRFNIPSKGSLWYCLNSN